ncbi:hypothetical protein C6P44_001966 [Monosporozyma unispora]|nr:hypothetical protein C6P44_001966 [Kazachstania unispora]
MDLQQENETSPVESTTNNLENNSIDNIEDTNLQDSNIEDLNGNDNRISGDVKDDVENIGMSQGISNNATPGVSVSVSEGSEPNSNELEDDDDLFGDNDMDEGEEQEHEQHHEQDQELEQEQGKDVDSHEKQEESTQNIDLNENVGNETSLYLDANDKRDDEDKMEIDNEPILKENSIDSSKELSIESSFKEQSDDTAKEFTTHSSIPINEETDNNSNNNNNILSENKEDDNTPIIGSANTEQVEQKDIEPNDITEPSKAETSTNPFSNSSNNDESSSNPIANPTEYQASSNSNSGSINTAVNADVNKTTSNETEESKLNVDNNDNNVTENKNTMTDTSTTDLNKVEELTKDETIKENEYVNDSVTKEDENINKEDSTQSDLERDDNATKIEQTTFEADNNSTNAIKDEDKMNVNNDTENQNKNSSSNNNNTNNEGEEDNDDDEDDDDDEDNNTNAYVGTPILGEDDKNDPYSNDERTPSNTMGNNITPNLGNIDINTTTHVNKSSESTINKNITSPSLKSHQALKQRPKLAFPQVHEIVIPNYASWLNLKKIHKIEIQSLPEWFTNRIASKTPEIYVKYRNFMINSYRLNPNEYFSVTAARRNLTGDAAALFRLHKFLMKWGLINYQVDSKLLPKTIEPPLTGENSTKHDAPRGYFPFESYKPSVQLPDMSKLKKMMDVNDPKSTLHHYLTEQRKRSIHHPETKQEPNNDNNISQDNATVEIKVDNNELHPAKRPKILEMLDESEYKSNGKWESDEIMKLLEGLQKFNSDWYEVAKFVGTKTPEQCILQFLQLPIEDKYLYQKANENGVGIGPLKYSPHLPFSKNDNPVLSTIAYLIGLVDPAIVKKMTDRALTEYNKQKEENENKTVEENVNKEDGKEEEDKKVEYKEKTEKEPSTESTGTSQKDDRPDSKSKDDLKEGSELALASLGLRSRVFANNEERKLNQVTNKLLQVQLSKVDIKLQKFNKVEKTLEIEKKMMQKKQEEFLIEKLSFTKNAYLLLNRLESTAKKLSATEKTQIEDDINELKKLVSNPLNMSFSSGNITTPVNPNKDNDTSDETDSNKNELVDDKTVKPVSIDAPQMYRYWSG